MEIALPIKQNRIPRFVGLPPCLLDIKMKRSRKVALAVGAVLIFTLTCLTAMFVIGPPGPNFVCHRLLDAGLHEWMIETTNKVQYPNVAGSSRRSLAVLVPYLGLNTNALRDYMYVPGLHSDDPENLILFYVKEPARRTWHGDSYWSLKPKRWIVLNPQMSIPDSDSSRAGGEVCEAISTAEFKDRLRITLDYLKRNNRLNWESIEKEQAQFLNSIPER
jgi:hypothetical protein